MKLPIKLDTASNGEYQPLPLDAVTRGAKQAAFSAVAENAKRLGLDRRLFVTSAAASASVLLAMNAAQAAAGRGAGRFELPAEAGLDDAAAQSVLADEDGFIFDVQTHMIAPDAPWRRSPARTAWERILAWMPQGACGEADPVDCFDAEHFIKEVFLDSDTDMAVLSFVPSPEPTNPLTMREADRTRRLIQRLDGTERLRLHAGVMPNVGRLQDQLDGMARAAAEWPVSAWKCYTQWGPDGVGWALDDPAVGIPFIEEARELGIRRICVHKGLSLRRQSPRFADCADVGRVAAMYPDVDFLIYHSGYERDRREGVFDPANAARGVDSLVKSLIDNDVPPNANVHAELGSTWRLVMRDADQAAHTLGKLMRHVGEHNLLWGTDSIWYGSPQDQIQAMRAFRFADGFAERHGYPDLDAAAKRRIFGENAARVYGVEPTRFRRKAAADPLDRVKTAYREEADPSFESYGPRTRREFLALHRHQAGRPD